MPNGPSPAQSEDSEPASELSLLEQMGGVSGLIYSTVPVLVFVPANSLFGLTAAIWSALAAAAAIALAASKPRPFLYVAHSLARRPGLVGFLFILSALLAYLILAQKSPFTALIDTFLLPIIAIILIDEQRDTVAFPVEMFLHVFLCLNALLGLFEVVSGWRLVPYVANGVEITSDWRATAIMGHPLANACVTGCYLLALLLRGGPHLVGLWRAAATSG
mgnify:CR=1 FL=1